jgi:ABC-type transport system involved in cytochrome bd biosynthesis fused ATPase/permease subunit
MEWFYLIIQILFAATAIIGIGLLNIPLAIVTLGLLGVWAMQRSLIALDLARQENQARASAERALRGS